MVIHKFTLFDALLYFFIFLICLSFLYPLVQQLAISVSDERVLGFKSVGIFPFGFSLDSYELLFTDRKIIRYYFNTIKYATVGTLIMLVSTSMMAIPDALLESAYMDGAGHFNVLYRIIIPLSKPLLATFTLFHVVGHWNDFFNALIFLRDQEKQPVQLFLRRILVLLDFREVEDTSALQMMNAISSRTVKGAAVIITITPILCIYPFLQKYFTKGILVGALKN